jgi:hypothetical protein
MTVPFSQRAKIYWTDERVKKVTGGKNFLILPSEAPDLLRTMDLLNNDGSMAARKIKKYAQINHMLTLMVDALHDLKSRHEVIRIVDVCCGNSFLSLILGWYLKEKLKHPFKMIGIDHNAKVVEQSNVRIKTLGLSDEMNVTQASLSDSKWQEALQGLRPHMVIALHACDTASDYALAQGIELKADYLAIAPCCQAELARSWSQRESQQHDFEPIFRSPNLRREVAAHMTDALRMLLTRSHGYEVTAKEFVSSAHTPKNRLLYCVRRGNYLETARQEYDRLKHSLGDFSITLETLLAR